MRVRETIERSRAWLLALVAALLFTAALYVLRRELRSVHYGEVMEAVNALPGHPVLLALLLTAANYLVLTGYDHLAIRHIGQRIGMARITLVSFVSYAIANNLGFPLLSGTAARYRFYSRWGLNGQDLSRVVVFSSSAVWLGLLALGGWSLIFHPHPAFRGYAAEPLMRAFGGVLIAAVAGYMTLSVVRRGPVVVRDFEFRIPEPRLALGQFGLSAADWLLAAAVFHLLLPPGGPRFGVLLGAFLGAQLIGVVSHVPGGLGVFEGAMMVALRQYFAPKEILASLLLYRLVYYLVPLVASLAILVVDEVRLRRQQLVRVGTGVADFTRQVIPTLLAVFTFAAGIVLLFSGALPAEPDRLRWLDRFLPLGMFEASHFLGSVTGVLLLFVGQGLRRRLDVAYYLAVTGLALGMAFSLLKAGDYEEAIVLGGLLLAFLPARSEFDRRAAFFDAPFSPGWTIAAVAAISASVWLGFFAFRHVEYTHQLWWRFGLNHDAPRFLRASAGATVALLGLGAARLLSPAAPAVPLPDERDLADVERILATQSSCLPFLAFLRDKAILFDDARSAFLMYGVQGRTWVALGNPVGSHKAARSVVDRFLERVDDFGGTPVFYQVPATEMHMYADVGLTFAKLGEEARVRLADFSLEGPQHRDQRAAIKRFEREGVEFRIVAPHDVPGIIDQLRVVSDDWLERRGGSEKGFSVGFFEPAYLARFPVAIVSRGGRVVAFATVQGTTDRQELTIDLMRFSESAPKGVMDGLFGHLMLWGKQQGYVWFSLGMAPLAGVQTSPLARAWPRVARWAFRHGGAFYNFEGLRAFKEKFQPEWEPRYLAYAGGLKLARVLADIAVLVAGGWSRIVH